MAPPLKQVHVCVIISCTIQNKNPPFTPGGGDSHMKLTGMLIRKLELNP